MAVHSQGSLRFPFSCSSTDTANEMTVPYIWQHICVIHKGEHRTSCSVLITFAGWDGQGSHFCFSKAKNRDSSTFLWSRLAVPTLHVIPALHSLIALNWFYHWIWLILTAARPGTFEDTCPIVYVPRFLKTMLNLGFQVCRCHLPKYKENYWSTKYVFSAIVKF